MFEENQTLQRKTLGEITRLYVVKKKIQYHGYINEKVTTSMFFAEESMLQLLDMPNIVEITIEVWEVNARRVEAIRYVRKDGTWVLADV